MSIASRRGIMGKKKYGNKTLQHIEKKGEETPYKSKLSGDICGPYVPTASLSDVDACHSTGNDSSEWDGPEKISSHNQEN
jgi:hypothetical protein